ncbi:hypothetical protein GCM10007320_08840 [Pseudorhodoferax aquiterrae]|uniref:4Fe-4S ferredoxin-type domain-containing protein n=1 Tax=Pseudorhodoferax aquiterrae TaxID=747304 RepID=A0ABQ3FXQ7_9BURK|nr:hypothetical protein [Pseudorhodoferax aquiterrae]GHC72750.1 hypothetical protein GCM10007320_08840 [Pseudorhodoferax aquiterrae]
MRCALCGRCLDKAAMFIGQLPVGPTCARRHGLMAKARKRFGSLWVNSQHVPRAGRPRPDTQTLDLFEAAA